MLEMLLLVNALSDACTLNGLACENVVLVQTILTAVAQAYDVQLSRSIAHQIYTHRAANFSNTASQRIFYPRDGCCLGRFTRWRHSAARHGGGMKIGC